MRTICRKYKRLDAPHLPPLIAPLPAKLKERHKMGPGLAAKIITDKYELHLPLYRQQRYFETRFGVHLPRQTLSRWLDDAASWLELMYWHIRHGVFGSGYVQMDETPVSFLEPGNGKTIKGYLWGARSPGGDVCYDWSSGGRGMDRLDELIPKDFTGKVQSDAYRAYEGFIGRNADRITHLYCWAHARRKFFEAAEAGCRKAAIIVHLIRLMYAMDKAFREKQDSPVLVEAHRTSSVRMVSNRIFALLERWKRKRGLLPSSATAQAIEYTLKCRSGLDNCLASGDVELDNNLMENDLRPIAVGRRNWLFFGSRDSGQKSAILFTIVENCRRRKIDCFAYLHDVFTNLGEITNQNLGDWTPAGWAKRQRPQAAAMSA